MSAWLFWIDSLKRSLIALSSSSVSGLFSGDGPSSLLGGLVAGLFLGDGFMFFSICAAALAVPSVRLCRTYHFLAVFSEWHIRRRKSSSSICPPCCFFAYMVVTIHLRKSVAVIVAFECTPLFTAKEEIRFPSVPRGKGCPSDLRKMRLDGDWLSVTLGLTFWMNTSIRKAVSRWI